MSRLGVIAIGVLACGAAGLAGCGALEPTAPGEPSPTAPPIGFGRSATEIKYSLIQVLGEPFFCDPDYYPVARADESELAQSWFEQVDKRGEEFQAILRQLNLPDSAGLTADQLLASYREHKRLSAISVGQMGEAYRFEMRVSEGDTGSLLVGTIDRAGRIEIECKETSFNTCPICLDGATRIATPDGELAVEELKAGMLVWSMDDSGSRIAAPILRTVRVRVPLDHSMIHLVLEDGRELIASPGHPLADGRRLGTVLLGEHLEGSPVVLAEWVEWEGTYTYDILPASETGLYWANGVLLRSTLSVAGR
ncbi:MAG: Hint domain-containing protein [Anaerolineales bacterium]